jgi:Xaa-Pro aminopeptidase
VDAAFSTEALDARMPALLANQKSVWFPFATHEGLDARVDGWLDKVRARVRLGDECPQSRHDLCGVLDEMRLFKDSHEIAILRRAGKISAGAHVRAMQTSAAMLRNPVKGVLREYHLEAELLHEFRRHGSQFPAYTSIVAAGANACVLHYRAGDAELKAGELCLIDAGCELDGYASDITRTFPADGKFTPAQRRLYDIVTESQYAAVKATKPGKRFNDPHEAALRVLAQGMLDTGLLPKAKHGQVDDVLESGAYRQFYMHRTSHWMGMDVHDCGDYSEPGSKPRPDRDAMGQPIMRKPSRILRPGMVLTIEPGIYVRPGKNVPKEFWNIGIRIEDDALVTAKGCELMTRGVPVDGDEIERLMAGEAGRPGLAPAGEALFFGETRKSELPPGNPRPAGARGEHSTGTLQAKTKEDPFLCPCVKASSNTEYPDKSPCAKCSRCHGACKGLCSACRAALPRMPGTGVLIAWP